MRVIKTSARRTLCGLLAGAIAAASIAAHAQTLFPDDEFLPPDEAFRMSIVRAGADFIARWEIADRYYLYRDKFRIESEHGNVASKVPPGLRLKDEFFGETDVFRHFVEIPFSPPAGAGDALVSLRYQGCADAGLCYPPVIKQVNLSRVPGATRMNSAAAAPATPAPPVSEQFRVLQQLKDSNLLAVALAFLGFGLLLAFTPCILPMVPILSGLIIGNSGGRGLSSGKTFSLSLSYVLAMAVTYSLFGVVIGLTGESLQAWFQQPWVIGSFAAVFALLALSMFGLYDLQMPAAVQTRLSAWSNRVGGDKHPALGTAAVMGCLSALIVGPCTTAPLIGALLFIAQTGDAVIGGVALFSLALGMGIPLLIIGTSLGKLLPRPGPMLDAVKAVFGLLLLGVAVWLLDRVTPPGVILLLSGAVLMLAAAYLHQIAKRAAFALGGSALTQGLAAVILLYGALLVAGAATGGSSLLRPLEHFAAAPGANATAQIHALDFKPVRSLQQLQQEISLAEQRGQPVMLDFYADWCVTCKEMEAFTFSDNEVRAALAGLTLLQADVTQNNDADKELLRHFGLFGPPAILFFDANSYEFESARIVGYMNAGRFARHVEQTFNTRRI